MGRGRFITFEGIDGSGKSTALAHIGRAMPNAHTTREETDAPTGAWVRQSIAQGMDPLATTYLFLADRAQHVPAIEAHLSAGTDVLCDRYLHSTLAYQAVTLEGRVADPPGLLKRLHEPIHLRPDRVLLFHCDPARAVERVARRGAATPYEKAAFLQRVQDAYLALAAEDPRIHVLDAERPIEAVVAEAAALVQKWLA